MAITTRLRETVGNYALCAITGFVELEAAIAATTIIRHSSTIADAAGDPVMPYPGVIVGMSGACEAGSNFTVQVTVNGTPDTGVTMTVNAAAVYESFEPSDYVEFAAGQTVGMYCVADTTSKDFEGIVWVLFDMNAE